MQTKIFGNDIIIFSSEDPSIVHSHIRTCFNSESNFSNESFLLTNLGSVMSNILKWNILFPTVTPMFNVQMNKDSMVLKFLNNFGVNFKIMNGNEINVLKDCDVDLSNVFYHGPCKINRHVKLAEENNVRYLTFNSISQLKKIHSIHPNAKFIFSLSMNHFKSDGTERSATKYQQDVASINTHVDQIYDEFSEAEKKFITSGDNLKQNLCYTNSYASDVEKIRRYVDPLECDGTTLINDITDAEAFILSMNESNDIQNDRDNTDDYLESNSDKFYDVCEETSEAIENKKSSGSDDDMAGNSSMSSTDDLYSLNNQNGARFGKNENTRSEKAINGFIEDLEITKIQIDESLINSQMNLDTSTEKILSGYESFEIVNSTSKGLSELSKVLEYAMDIGADIVGFSLESSLQEFIKDHYRNLLDKFNRVSVSNEAKSLNNICKESIVGVLEDDKFLSDFFGTLSLFLEKSLDFGFNINLIDLGESITVLPKAERDSIFAHFNNEISFFQSKHRTIMVYADPSRFLIDDSVDLCCTIVGAKKMPSDNFMVVNENKMFYYLNDGIYGSLNNVIFDGYLAEPFVLRENETFDSSEFKEDLVDSDASYESVFWGPTCDSMDKICTVKKMKLLQIGDVIVFKNVGSYGSCASSNFNGFNIAENKHYMSNAWADVVNEKSNQN